MSFGDFFFLLYVYVCLCLFGLDFFPKGEVFILFYFGQVFFFVFLFCGFG